MLINVSHKADCKCVHLITKQPLKVIKTLDQVSAAKLKAPLHVVCSHSATFVRVCVVCVCVCGS